MTETRIIQRRLLQSDAATSNAPSKHTKGRREHKRQEESWPTKIWFREFLVVLDGSIWKTAQSDTYTGMATEGYGSGRHGTGPAGIFVILRFAVSGRRSMFEEPE